MTLRIAQKSCVVSAVRAVVAGIAPFAAAAAAALAVVACGPSCQQLSFKRNISSTLGMPAGLAKQPGQLTVVGAVTLVAAVDGAAVAFQKRQQL